MPRRCSAPTSLPTLPYSPCTSNNTFTVLDAQRKEVAYIEKVLGLEIHHKLDINQFRNKMYERPKVSMNSSKKSMDHIHAHLSMHVYICTLA